MTDHAFSTFPWAVKLLRFRVCCFFALSTMNHLLRTSIRALSRPVFRNTVAAAAAPRVAPRFVPMARPLAMESARFMSSGTSKYRARLFLHELIKSLTHLHEQSTLILRTSWRKRSSMKRPTTKAHPSLSRNSCKLIPSK